jgi:hypothetical protein
MCTVRAYRRIPTAPVVTLTAVETELRRGSILAPEEWRPRQAAHQARVDAWIGPHLSRRRTGTPHPVEDFLFTYYSHRPAALRRWHPGSGVVLEDAEEHLGFKGYGAVAGGAGVLISYLAAQRGVIEALRRLLAATAGRPAFLGCFGLHEWAMLYRLPADRVRHSTWPLRLGAEGTDRVVEGHRVSCSHFDAFRFFTDDARPLNSLRPASRDRPDFEQPGCLHAGMDLYKHAARLSPMIASELVADCFELARDIRVLDMRASPYDLTALGHEPVRIETAQGKQEYVAAQRTFAARAEPLRRRLVAECDRLLAG